MKGYIKVIIAGAVILAVGIAVLVVALGLNGWNVEGDYETKTYECQETNSTLKVDFAAGKLEINYYDGEKIKVEYPENKRMTATVTEEGGTLTYKTTYTKAINFNWFGKAPEAKIWLPQNSVVALDLEMNAGIVKIADGTYDTVKISMNAGTLTLGEIVCQKLTLDMNAGSASIAKADSVQGVKCTMNAGSLNIDAISCPSFAVDVSAGSCNVSEIRTDEIGVDLSAGSVHLNIAGVAEEYGVFVDKSAGSCNISSRSGTTEKRITADISAGSLNVSFTN